MKNVLILFFILTSMVFPQKLLLLYDEGVSSIDLIAIAVINNGYIGTTGDVLSPDPNWRYTDYLDIQGGSQIQIKMLGHPAINTYSFYDSEQSYLSGGNVAASLDLFDDTVDIPVNAVFIRFSFGEQSFVETAEKVYYCEAVLHK